MRVFSHFFTKSEFVFFRKDLEKMYSDIVLEKIRLDYHLSFVATWDPALWKISSKWTNHPLFNYDIARVSTLTHGIKLVTNPPTQPEL
jgi:hypothetical protein